MATWMSNYLASLGVGPEFEPYFTGVLYDQTLSEEDKSATIYDCLETNCTMVRASAFGLFGECMSEKIVHLLITIC